MLAHDELLYSTIIYCRMQFEPPPYNSDMDELLCIYFVYSTRSVPNVHSVVTSHRTATTTTDDRQEEPSNEMNRSHIYK